jgi:hypothetical protein
VASARHAVASSTTPGIGLVRHDRRPREPSAHSAFLLRNIARDEHADNRTRLHCLRAAEILDPSTGMPAATGTHVDAAAVIRDALRLLAALPAEQFTDQVRTASMHARQALYELDPTP